MPLSPSAPERLTGPTNGMFNVTGGLAGILSPIIIGPPLRGGDFCLNLTFIPTIAALGGLLLRLRCRQAGA